VFITLKIEPALPNDCVENHCGRNAAEVLHARPLAHGVAAAARVNSQAGYGTVRNPLRGGWKTEPTVGRLGTRRDFH
jgi:hypothetical protein